MSRMQSVCLSALISFLIVFPVQAKLKSPGVIINIPSRTLELYSVNALVKEYSVAVGKPSTPTPVGVFSIRNMEVNPAWIPPDKVDQEDAIVPSGPYNPLGYRWMEFLATYGIHGTNNPASIGKVVSNGCIRMNEKDVEEVFEQIGIGTPVQILYDRVKIRYDDQGQATIGIYPDVYGKQSLSLPYLRARLAAEGLNWLVSDDVLKKLLDEQGEKQVAVAKIYRVKIADKKLDEKAVVFHDKVYVPVWPVVGALQASAVWKEQAGMIQSGDHAVAGMVRDNMLLATAEDVERLFGMPFAANQKGNLLEYHIATVVYENVMLTSDIQMIDGVMAVPVQPLADGLAEKLTYDWTNKIIKNKGKRIPFVVIDEHPYITVDKISDCFGVQSRWNDNTNTLELFRAKG